MSVFLRFSFWCCNCGPHEMIAGEVASLYLLTVIAKDSCSWAVATFPQVQNEGGKCDPWRFRGIEEQGLGFVVDLGFFGFSFIQPKKLTVFPSEFFLPAIIIKRNFKFLLLWASFSCQATGSVLASSMTKILTVGINVFKFFIPSLSCLGSSTLWCVFPYLCGTGLRGLVPPVLAWWKMTPLC